MTSVVLDASALLALLLDEPGCAIVQSSLIDSALCSVNLSEVIGHFARNGANEKDIRLVLDPLPITHHHFDEQLAYTAGLLLPLTKSIGLSFGDRACLALGHRLGSKVLTADRAWQKIAALADVEVQLIR